MIFAAQNAAWGTSTYLYDPLGERKQKVVVVNTVMPVATDFVLAGGEEIADYYETSATWRLTVRGAGGLPLAAVVPAGGDGSEEIVYVHHDMKDSTVALTVPGSSGPAESYTYSDYGAPQSGTWLAYQYAGYRYDSETGLYTMPARFYSPALGRFLQADPSGFSGGFNLYAYAGNDPVNQVDPTGLTPDGGGYTVTLSETIATSPFTVAAGGPSSMIVSVTAHSVPHLVLVQGKVTNYGDNNGYLSVLWSLKNSDGSQPNKQYYVTEQQSVHRLAKTHPNSGRTVDYPNQFDDEVGTTPMESPVNSYQTFSISTSPPDSNGWSAGSMHVNVEIGGLEYYGLQLHLNASNGGPGTSESGVLPQ